MIGKKENNHQTELVEVYNQVSDWLSSPQAVTDVENILYNNFRKGLERIDEEISSLGFESDLWTIRAFYKNGRISELFTFTHFTNWLKDTKEDHFDRILEKFETTSIPIDVGIALKKLSHLQFFWNIKTSEVSVSYLGNKAAENLLEIGIVNNFFKFTEKAHKKGSAKIILDYLLLGETEKLNQVIKKILQELEVDFKEIQERVKAGLLKNGDLSDTKRIINLRANLDYYTKDKEYRRIIIPFKFRCNQESQGTYESQLTSKIYEISYKLENGKIDGKSPKEFIKEFAHSQLVTEYLQITQKYSETTLSTFLKLLQKGTSSEFDTDRNYYSEVVTEVRKYVYQDSEDFKHLDILLNIFDWTELFTEEDVLSLLNNFVKSSTSLNFSKSNLIQLRDDWFQSFLLRKNFQYLSISTIKTSLILDSLKRYSDKVTYQNKTVFHLQFGALSVLNQFLVPRYQKQVSKDIDEFLKKGSQLFSDNQKSFGSTIIISSSEPSFNNYRVAKLLLDTFKPQRVLFVDIESTVYKDTYKLVEMIKDRFDFEIEFKRTNLNDISEEFGFSNILSFNQLLKSNSCNQVGEEIGDVQFTNILESINTLLEIKKS